MLGAQPEADQGNIRLLPGGDGRDFLHVDLARDHVVAQLGHDLREQVESVAPLVRDQNA